MGDPVSSVAYAIEAALRALHGDLLLLLPAMGIVLGIIVLVSVNYHQLYARFPGGGGDAAAAGRAFGEGWAFVPLGSLIVDYTLTITISVAAGASAVIGYLPGLQSERVPLALALLCLVAALTWFGHGGRSLFGLMTIGFLLVSSAVIVLGLLAPHAHGHAPLRVHDAHWPPVAVLLAFPVAMALATGVEAPSSAIAQLGQLDDAGRRRFGRITLWLMLVIVVWLTVGLTVLAVRLRVGIPPANSTQVAEIARTAVGNGPLFAAFQLTTALLLLAAASSSFQAGPGLLKALAGGGQGLGILPARLGRANHHHTPYWSVAVFLVVAAALVVAAGGREQQLVLFYAVAVFLAFLSGLLAMSRFFRTERRRKLLAVSTLGAGAVTLTLALNLARGYPIASLAAAAAIAGALWRLWVRAGGPGGVSEAERLAEADPPPPPSRVNGEPLPATTPD
ncbi:MAG TPA: amino acid permease [Solirubrobacteraceae bacterium]